MELASPHSNFQSDLDFCPDCGSVLPLPGAQDTVICPRCGFSIDVRGEGLVPPSRGCSGRVRAGVVGVTSALVGLNRRDLEQESDSRTDPGGKLEWGM